MAAVIPKLSINPRALSAARKKLQTKQPDEITPAEREAVLRLIQRAKRKLYPEAMAIDQYQYHINQLSKIDRLKEPARFDHFAAKVEAFENKYCK
jgi:hypothetical protein